MADVDLNHAADYPIVLGDSLKNDAQSSLLAVKYNWAPKNGFKTKPGKLGGNSDAVTMTVGEAGEQCKYGGWLSDANDEGSQIVLVYDSDRALYVLEKLTASFDMNIKSADNLPSDQIRRHSPLSRPQGQDSLGIDEPTEDDLFNDLDDGSPDSSHPFDFRHFIDEAKELADKQQAHGSGTPLTGARTPLSGFSSPLPGHGFPGASTPQNEGITIVSSTDKKLDEKPWRRQAASKSKPKAKPKARQPMSSTKVASSSKSAPKSSARVDDSDMDSDVDESGESSHESTALQAPRMPKATHDRHMSASSAAKSPQIVVTDGDMSDDSSDSAPPPVRTRNMRHIEDRSSSESPDVDVDVEMPDADDALISSNPYLIDADDDDDAAGGGDDFVFEDEPAVREPSPPPAPVKVPTPPPPVTKPAAKSTRRKNSTVKKRKTKPASPPPQQRSNSTHDYDEDALAATLEAEFEAMGDDADDDVDAEFLSRNAIARNDPSSQESEESEEE